MATPTTTTMAPDPPQTTAPQMQPPPRQLDSSVQAVDAQSGCLPIELDGLSHSYGERLALDHLTFNVGAAEIFGLLGPNGSGKTTLFRILSTLMVPTGGTAKILGFDAAREPNRVRQQIGVVFQARSLDLKLTARENLIHQGHLYGLSGKQLGLRVNEILERVGLLDRANDLVETLSGGMQRRVELAKGLIHRPRVLLLDEPTTGLDPGARIDIWQYLRMLRNDEGLAILVTTHLMEEAEHCDRLAILNEGSVVALGRPADLKAGFGGEVISLDAQDEAAARSLATSVELKLQVQPTVLGRTVRVELPQGQRFLVEVLELFSDQILSVTIAKPSLEDVFIRCTGHRFWSENQDASAMATPQKGPALMATALNRLPTLDEARPPPTTALWLPAYTLWQRELVRFYRQKSRVVGVIASPLVFWVLLGSGLSRSFHSGGAVNAGAHGEYFRYFFPGSLVMILLFTAIFSMMSLIQDRNEGFMLSVLAAPVSRSAIVLGKVAGGATLAAGQGIVFLIFAPLLGVHFTISTALLTLLMIALISFSLTALGFAIAWPLDSPQAFHAIVNMILIPLWLLSGAVFPASGATGWLRKIMRLNPLTYGVDGLRNGLFPDRATDFSPAVNLGVSFGFCAVVFALSWLIANRRTNKPAA